ncbi:hypothetical protein QNH14_23695 (plasmid) [Apirhabdus apintestini]|nr:hypothetical protein QNH14_23695 [Enterobacteriaceae bacterium CA-0114]
MYQMLNYTNTDRMLWDAEEEHAYWLAQEKINHCARRNQRSGLSRRRRALFIG